MLTPTFVDFICASCLPTEAGSCVKQPLNPTRNIIYHGFEGLNCCPVGVFSLREPAVEQ